MTCHHDGADDLPAFLCRKCHPELNKTPEQRAVLIEAERKAQAERAAAEAKARDLRLATMKLASLTRNGEPAEGSVSAKIAASVRRKVERLSV